MTIGDCDFLWTHTRVSNRLTAISIDCDPIVGFKMEDNNLLLQLALFDEHNVPILTVVDSELVLSTDAWDSEFVGNRLIIRRAARQIALDVRFQPPDTIHISRGHLFHNNVELLIGPKGIAVVGDACHFSGMGFENITTAFHFGRGELPGSAGFAHPAPTRDQNARDEKRPEMKRWVQGTDTLV